MFSPRSFLPVVSAGFAALASLSPCHSQTLVYAANGGGANFGMSTDDEIANGLHLASESTHVDSLSLSFYSSNAANMVAVLSFYEAVPNPDEAFVHGISGELDHLMPASTPFWSSGPVSLSLAAVGSYSSPVYQTLVFSNIDTLVPQNLFWSLSFESIQTVPWSTPPDFRPPSQGYASFGYGLSGKGGQSVDGTSGQLGYYFYRYNNGEQPAWGFRPYRPAGFGNGQTVGTGPSYVTPWMSLTGTSIPEAGVLSLAACAGFGLARRTKR